MKLQQYSGIKRAVMLMAVSAAVLAGIYIAVRLGIFFAPFVIAFVLSSLIEPLIRYLKKRLGIGRSWSVPFILAIILTALGYVLTLLVSRLINEAKSVAHTLPGVIADWYARIDKLADSLTGAGGLLPPEITQGVESILASLFNSVAGLCDSLLKGIFNTAVSLPQALVFILVTVMSTYFISIDRTRLVSYTKDVLPKGWAEKIASIRSDMFSALSGYLKATLILMGVTFAELFTGFSFMHVSYALLLAFFIALIDALPVLGTGTVLIPWAIYGFFSGNLRTAVSLLLLYIVILIVRQVLEPRIVGRQLGIHPLAALFCMYAGLKLAGIAGMLLGPISFLLLKSIMKFLLRPSS